MSLFGHSRKIAIQNMQTLVNHRQVWKQKRRIFFYKEKKEVVETVYNESPLKESESSGMRQFSLAGLLLGKEKFFLPPGRKG